MALSRKKACTLLAMGPQEPPHIVVTMKQAVACWQRNNRLRDSLLCVELGKITIKRSNVHQAGTPLFCYNGFGAMEPYWSQGCMT